MEKKGADTKDIDDYLDELELRDDDEAFTMLMKKTSSLNDSLGKTVSLSKTLVIKDQDYESIKKKCEADKSKFTDKEFATTS